MNNMQLMYLAKIQAVQATLMGMNAHNEYMKAHGIEDRMHTSDEFYREADKLEDLAREIGLCPK